MGLLERLAERFKIFIVNDRAIGLFDVVVAADIVASAHLLDGDDNADDPFRTAPTPMWWCLIPKLSSTGRRTNHRA